MNAAKVLSRGYEVDARLAELGLSASILREAGAAARQARSISTPFHPKWFEGNTMYSNALATLGFLLKSHGFIRMDPGGRPLVVSHDRKLALVVATSDGHTGNGDLHHPPQTRPWKGPRTEEAVQENDLLLFSDMFELESSHHPLDGYAFWWLLLHADAVASTLRLELSRGTKMGKRRAVVSWNERIMLESLPLDSVGLTINQPPDDEPPNGTYEVDVKRLG